MRYKAVTLWHRESGGGYTKLIFKRAIFDRQKRAEILAHEYERCDKIGVRLFCTKEYDIDVGDRLILGTDNESSAPPDTSYIITLVKDNTNTCRQLKHYRIECE